MKIIFAVGLIILILGVVSLFVPIPRRETHGFKAGDINIAVQTRNDEKVSPIISAVLIVAGAGLMIAGSRRG
ncbi:MAG TPA: hypothetical protein VK699_03860 [Terriglobales bacterium]|nr:hypothetical protein [Terriglobales bacterium]